MKRLNKNLKLLLLLTFLLKSFVISDEWNPIVKRDSRVVTFLIQLSTRYNIPLPSSIYQQPLHRKDVANFLELALVGNELSKIESEYANLIYNWYKGDRTLFSRSNDQAQIKVNASLTGDIDTHLNDSLIYGLKGIVNPAINGNIGPISFASEFLIWTEIQNDTVWRVSNYEPYNGNPYNLFGRNDTGSIRSSDMFRAAISYEKKIISLDIGVDNLTSGPVLKNRLTLNLDRSPAPFIRYKFDFEMWNYTHIFGSLKSMKDYSKYFAYHRLEVPLLNKKFIIAINEIVVYGSSADSAKTANVHSNPLVPEDYEIDRTVEPVYLIPFVPFAFVEHYNGDRDNAIISLDMSLRFPQNFLWYFEFLVDDISNPATLFSDDFGNKWGLSVGGQWSYNLAKRPFTANVEYSRIEPWVYTHFKGVSHRFTHFGESAGSELGPNSDQLWAEIAWQVSKLNKFSFGVTQKRWNKEYRGGDISHVFVISKNSEANDIPEDSETKKFLSGNITKDHLFEIGWQLLPFQIFEVDSRVSYSSLNGFGLSFYGGFRF
jgi:hypothetical protein